MIIFTDIDDTIMQTKRKIPDMELEHCIVGAHDRNDIPLSYIDPKRQKMLKELFDQNITIPVTARSRSAFEKLKISFKSQVILNSGATILDYEKNDYPEWNELIREKSIALQQDSFFNEIKNRMEHSDLKEHITINIKQDNGLSLYLNIKFNDADETMVGTDKIKQKITEEFKLENFYFFQTCKELAVLPYFIKKELAVKYLIDKFYPNDLLLGVGDHRNDFPFMSLCTFMMAPNDSMLTNFLKGI